MKCDIIVISWNYPEVTRACLEHILKNTHYPFRLIVVDNASEQDTVSYLERLKNESGAEILLIKNSENLGFVKAVNKGLEVSNAPYACIFNNDTLPGENWLTEMVEFAEEHPDVGLLNPICGGHIQNNMTVNEYAHMLSKSNKGKYMEMNQCQGFCMLVKREVLNKLGFLDEIFDTVGFDDTDYSRRAHREGYKSVCVYSSYVYHKEHESFGKMGDRKKIQSVLEERYFKKWPKHKRIAIVFSLSQNTSDEKVKDFLSDALLLAREWCWVNLFVYGDKKTEKRIGHIKSKINFPLHQNLKFNYLDKHFKLLDIIIRILERSFGSKSRKKYDAVICNEKKLIPFLKLFCKLQGCKVFKEKGAVLAELIPATTASKVEPGKCDIILPVCDQYDFTKKCVESIIENTDTPYRLIVINNGKNPDTRKFLDELGQREDVETTIVHNNHNVGWVKALNKGIKLSNAPYVCFQNDDTIVTRGWLRKMIDTLKLQENFGMINPTWCDRPGEKYSGKKNFQATKNIILIRI